MKFFVAVFFLIAAFSWAAFAYLIWFVPPDIEGQLAISNILYVFLSGFLALGISVSLVLYFFENFLAPKSRATGAQSQPRRLFFRSLRRGFLFSLVTTSVVALNVLNLSNILNVGLVVGIAILVEIYLSSR
ncbi:MAG: hypothetical protein WD187_03990 [Candidatus Woykebacteria bacterium]